MKLVIEVRVNKAPMFAMRKAVSEKAGSDIMTLLEQVLRIYAAEMRRRFVILSRGGSWNGQTWHPLSPRTIAGRRHGRGTRGSRSSTLTRSLKRSRTRLLREPAGAGREKTRVKIAKQRRELDALLSGSGVAILRDKGILFSGLTIGASANKTEKGQGRITFGFADTPHGPGGPSISELAAIHQRGGSHLPAREILVAPSAEARKRMNDLARQFLQDEGKKFQSRGKL